MKKKMTFEQASLEISQYHYGEIEEFPFEAVKAFGIATMSNVCDQCAHYRDCPLKWENIRECNFYILKEE